MFVFHSRWNAILIILILEEIVNICRHPINSYTQQKYFVNVLYILRQKNIAWTLDI